MLKKGAPISEEKGNTNLHFEQGIVHKEYLDHLYNLFAGYCNSAPNISDRLPDKRTNKIYTRIQFVTYSLPCFNYLYDLFYFEGKKFVPLNIEEHFTALSLAYWLCDDGYYDKKNKRVIFATLTPCEARHCDPKKIGVPQKRARESTLILPALAGRRN